MKYMLDTDICIYMIKNYSEKMKKHLGKCEEGDICVSVITYAELEYGVQKSKYASMNKIALTKALSDFEVLPFDGVAAEVYGEIKTDLEKQGKPIGPNDLLIAAHAKALGLTLVTNNTKEFKRVKGLKVENWT